MSESSDSEEFNNQFSFDFGKSHFDNLIPDFGLQDGPSLNTSVDQKIRRRLVRAGKGALSGKSGVVAAKERVGAADEADEQEEDGEEENNGDDDGGGDDSENSESSDEDESSGNEDDSEADEDGSSSDGGDESNSDVGEAGQEPSKKKQKASSTGDAEHVTEMNDKIRKRDLSSVKPKTKKEDEFFAPTPALEFADTFDGMHLSRALLKAINDLNWGQPTPVQRQVVPVALMGRDVCASAVTGSGKTAAFWLPTLERLLMVFGTTTANRGAGGGGGGGGASKAAASAVSGKGTAGAQVPILTPASSSRQRRAATTACTRVLALCPTRELAVQCYEVLLKLAKYVDVSAALACGGMSLSQQTVALRQRPDIVVGTPGRLIDHLRNTPDCDFDHVEVLIVDEADRMLELGFEDELNELVKACPRGRQSLLLSATMTEKVDELVRLSLHRPVRIRVDGALQVAPRLRQEFVRLRASASRPDEQRARETLCLAVCNRVIGDGPTLVFVATKAGARRLKILFGLCGLRAAELHADKTQTERLAALEGYRRGDVQFLICTDVAARGLDIARTRFVLNFNLPRTLKSYIHRVGRTARAAASGCSISIAGEKDRALMKQILAETVRNQQQTNPGPAQSNSKIYQRSFPPDVLQLWENRIDECEPDIEQISKEEKEEQTLAWAERDITKAQNMIDHADEIYSKPARTWFQSTKEKEKQKEKDKQRVKQEQKRAERDPAEVERERKRKKAKDKEKERDKLRNKQKAAKRTMGGSGGGLAAHSSKHKTKKEKVKNKINQRTEKGRFSFEQEISMTDEQRERSEKKNRKIAGIKRKKR